MLKPVRTGMPADRLRGPVYAEVMSDEEPIDYEAVRRRFPWVGMGDSGEHDLSVRYREIMAEARKNREVVEAIDAVRFSA
jgi:hypothetical protein